MVHDQEKVMLLNLIKHQRQDIDKIYLYGKDTFESKYQLLINGREEVGTEILKYTKALIDYSQTIDDVYENLEDYNPTMKRAVLIAFDDMITEMELLLRGRKFNISLVYNFAIR